MIKKIVSISCRVLVIAGIVTISAELLLRLCGVAYTTVMSRNRSVPEGTAGKTILCYGDSFTFGLGAPPGQDYPSQLQKLFNQSSEHNDVAVINRGVPGSNCYQVLELFSDDIETYHPSMIVVLVGVNDNWNYAGYELYEKRGQLLGKIVLNIKKMRLYKLLTLISLRMHQSKPAASYDKVLPENNEHKEEEPFVERIPERERAVDNHSQQNGSARKKFSLKTIEDHFESQGRYDDAILLYNYVLTSSPSDEYVHARLGHVYMCKGEYEKSVEEYKKAISYNTNSSQHYLALGTVYRNFGHPAEAIACYKQALAVEPDDYYVYTDIAHLCFEDQNACSEMIAFVKSKGYDNALAKNFLAVMEAKQKREKIADSFRSHLEEIVRLCREHNIILVLQNYPHPYNENSFIIPIVKTCAARYSLVFVDNERAYLALRDAGVDIERLISKDGHVIAEGYSIMAKNIFNSIIDHNVLSEI